MAAPFLKEMMESYDVEFFNIVSRQHDTLGHMSKSGTGLCTITDVGCTSFAGSNGFGNVSKFI